MNDDQIALDGLDQPGRSAAQVARDEAIDRVERHAPVAWRVSALGAVRQIALRARAFTTDDIWDLVGPPPEPRAMGAVMRRAGRLGIARPTNRTQQSKRPECHARPLRVWESRL